MDYEHWNPMYERIRADFGYDRSADERARDVLAQYLTPFDTERLDVSGRTVAIAGGAESLYEEISTADSADVVFAASTAADVLFGADVAVDLLVTDLDKNPETAIATTHAGIPAAVHAHGDNIPKIRQHVPSMNRDAVLGTTQVAPTGAVYNFGGFTDGDRAAFLADHLDAESLVFPGWDFEDPTVDDEKRRKLEWAKRLLGYLERRRGDRFGVLDGYRSALDVPSPTDSESDTK